MGGDFCYCEYLWKAFVAWEGIRDAYFQFSENREPCTERGNLKPLEKLHLF